MKQQRKLEIIYKWEKEDDGSDLNTNIKVRAGDALLPSHVSTAVGCTLPEIGNCLLMTKQTGNIKPAHSGEVVPTHFPPLPVKAVAQQQVKKLSKCSTASSLALHSLQDRHDFQEQKLPLIPAGNRERSHPKQDRPMPVRLPPIENVTLSSSISAEHKRQMLAPGRVARSDGTWKLPGIKNTSVGRSKLKSENLQRLPSALPPISGRTEELDKNRKLPPIANMQPSDRRSAEKTKKRRKMM